MAFVAGVISALQALAFVVVWHFNRRMPGIGSWATAALLNGFALALIPTRSVVDSVLLTRVVPMTLNMAACVFFCIGASAFAGRRARLGWPLILSTPIFLGFLWFTLVDYQPRLRPLVTSPIFVLFIGIGSLELLRERRPGLQFSARLVGISVGIVGLLFLHRMVVLPFRTTAPELLDPSLPGGFADYLSPTRQ